MTDALQFPFFFDDMVKICDLKFQSEPCRTSVSKKNKNNQATEASILALNLRVDVTRNPKQGISGPTNGTYVFQKISKIK